MRDDIAIQPGELTIIPIYADPGHSKHVYVRGSLRGKPGSEYYLMPGEYEIRDGLGGLLTRFKNHTGAKEVVVNYAGFTHLRTQKRQDFRIKRFRI